MAKTKNESKKTVDVKKKKAEASVKKITASEEPKKIVTKEVKKIAAKQAQKRVTTKKVDKIETKIPLPIENKKTVKQSDKPIKKAVKKKITKESLKQDVKAAKKEYYEHMSLGECIHCMQMMNVQYGYEDYTQLLLDEGDFKVIEKNIIEGNHIKDLVLDYKKDGYDADIIPYTLKKVAETMDITAAEFKDIKKDIKNAMKFTMGNDPEKNAEGYLKEFHLCEKVLMIAQRKGISDSSQVTNELGVDITKFTEHFLNLAYAILPSWQYRDVVFYEDFICAYLSQYTDLYEEFEQRVLLDCADLYILHGDQQYGDDEYGYILRDNQIKDYIYYRFASIYVNIDLQKAKAIAQGALEYVDDRFLYYPNIIEILNY